MKTEHFNTLTSLFSQQKLGVLSTQQNDQPYASLVAFSFSPDLTQLFFLTGRDTQKFNNLMANTRAAILIHSAGNTPEAFTKAITVTALGKTKPVDIRDKNQENKKLNRFLARHPKLETFANAQDTVMVKMIPDQYILVSQFQNVEVIKMRG